jgi:molybdopterin converting factor subunit 1
MRVRVLYFGVLKDVFGRGFEEMELVGGASVADLIAACRGRYAGAREIWDSMAVAVNQEYARAEMVLREGDEVALLPPVSGGWASERKPNTGILHCVQDDNSLKGEMEVDAG